MSIIVNDPRPLLRALTDALADRRPLRITIDVHPGTVRALPHVVAPGVVTCDGCARGLPLDAEGLRHVERHGQATRLLDCTA